jgi:alpha-beta hydrolase superfamily lysophospholipase
MDGIAAIWRLRIAKADQFGLWPRSATTLGGLLCMQIKSCLPFSNSNPQFKTTDIIMSAITRNRMKNWEVISDNLSKAGWSWSCVSAIESSERRIWIADAHRGDGERYVAHADEKLTAFLELEAATWTHSLGRTYE